MRELSLATALFVAIATGATGLWLLYETDDSQPTERAGLSFDDTDHPVIAPTLTNLIRLDDGNSAEICVDGSGFGAEGRLVVGGVDADISSWTPQQICGTVDPHDVETGRLYVIDEAGRRSNSLGVLPPSQIHEWVIPETVYPSTILSIEGEHLTGIYPSGAPMLHLRQDDTLTEFTIPRPGDYALFFGGEAGPEITVHPKVLRSCSVGPKTRCRMLINRIGTSADIESVTVNGLDAEVHVATGAHLEFAWPHGLAPGIHLLRVELTSGVVETEVVMREFDSDTIVGFSPDAGFTYGRAHRPPLFDGHLVHPILRYFQGIGGAPEFDDYYLARQPLDDAERAVTQEGTDGYGLQLGLDGAIDTSLGPYFLVHDGELHMLGPSRSGSGARELSILSFAVDAQSGQWILDQSQSGLQPMNRDDRIAAARFYGDDLAYVVGATEDDDDPQSVSFTGFEIAPSTETALADANFKDTSVGWLSDDSVIISTCGSNAAPAGVLRAPLTNFDAESQTPPTVGEPQFLVDGTDDERHILACHGADDGFYWVERVQNEDRLYFVGSTAQPVHLATLPPEIAGVGARFETTSDDPSASPAWISGLLSMQATDSGDVYFLMADHQAHLATVQLLRWRADSDEFVAGGPTAVTMNSLPGEACVGPWDDRQICPEVGQFGCNLMACDQGFAIPVSMPTMQPIGAEIHVREEDQLAHLFLEVQRQTMPQHSGFHRVELQHHLVRTPQ